jgi:hypothetical protein
MSLPNPFAKIAARQSSGLLGEGINKSPSSHDVANHMNHHRTGVEWHSS